MKLIFVHGRSQGQKSSSAIQTEWLSALTRGLRANGLTLPDSVDVVVPFYGSRLDELLDQLNSTSLETVILRGTSDDVREAQFRFVLLQELARSQNISDADILKAVGGTVQERGPLNWEWVQGLLKVLDETPLGSSAIEAFTSDVYAYLHNRGVRAQIDRIVQDAFDDQPCVVVAHSLGTVVAYNVLRAMSRPVRAIILVTLGSPLGIRAVRDSLEPPLGMPASCGYWYNAYDEADVVALRPLDHTHFPTDPAIANHGHVINHTPNRHGIDGYLDDGRVARMIHQATINLM